MQKIYLLLRDNNQSGPFTIEELLDQELMPSDLVWIEGKSLAWSYVSELNLLKLSRHSSDDVHRHRQSPSLVHSVPAPKRKRHRFHKGEVKAAPPPPEQKPRPSGPLVPAPMSSAFSEGDVERKAEELRQRALEAERTFHYRQPTPAPSQFVPDLTGNMDSDIEVVYHKKGLVHNIPFPQMLVGGMVIAMLVAGWYGQPLFRQKIDTVDATATPLNAKENRDAAPIKPKPAQTAVLTDTTAVTDTTQPATTAASMALYTAGGATPQRSAVQPEPEPIVHTMVPETTAAEKPQIVTRKPEPEPEATKEPEKPAPVVVTAKKEPVETEPVATEREESKERKKGFLKGLFKKKKNRDGQRDDTSDQSDSAQEGN